MATILLVEDEPMVRDVLSRRLRLEGFEIRTAVDGAQGVAMARADPPDLILMDLGLPVLNGWQATHRLKSDPATQAIPIIAVTAYTLAEHRQQAVAAGFDAFVAKPVEMAGLLATISGLLKSQDAEDPARTV